MKKLLLLLVLGFQQLIVSSQTDSLHTRAHFPGGDRAFTIYWNRNFVVPLKYRYRFSVPEGEGLIQLEISANGQVQNVKIVKPLTPDLDQAALKAARKMPNWEPAISNGVAISSLVEFSYFLLLDQNGSIPVSLEVKNEHAKNHGLYMDLWGGVSIHTNDWGSYFNPVRASLGLEFGYRVGQLSAGIGWDVFGFSKVKKPFLFHNVDIQKDYRAVPIFVYFPIRYSFETASKWCIAPMIAPTLNYYEVNEGTTVKPSERDPVADETFFSWSAGVYLIKRTSIREYFNPVRKRMRYETSYFGARLMVNFAEFNKKQSTPMNGSAISIGFCINGWMQPGKKLAPANFR